MSTGRVVVVSLVCPVLLVVVLLGPSAVSAGARGTGVERSASVVRDAGLPPQVDPTPGFEDLDREARARLARGDRIGAAESMERAVEAARSGPDYLSLRTAGMLYRLGNLRRQIGPYETALDNLREALAVRERLESPAHPTPVVLIEAIDKVLGRLRPEDPERETLVLRALEQKESSSLHRQLADHYDHVGRHEEALLHLEEGLRVEAGRRSPFSGSVAAFHTSIARQLRELGRVDEAEWSLRLALEESERQLGESHPRLVPDLTRLGDYYVDEGRLIEAEEIFVRAEELVRVAWGGQGDGCGCSCGVGKKLADVRRAMGLESPAPEPDSANDDSIDPDPAVEEIRLLEGRIDDERARGEFDSAADAARRVLELREQRFGPAADEALVARHALGSLLLRGGRSGEAADVLLEGIDSMRAAGGMDPSLLAAMLRSAGRALHDARRYDESESILLEEVGIREDQGQRLRAASAHEMLGGQSRRSSAYDRAREHYEAAVRLWTEMAGERSP